MSLGVVGLKDNRRTHSDSAKHTHFQQQQQQGAFHSTFKAKELSLLYTSHRVLFTGGNGVTYKSFSEKICVLLKRP